jgi:hypothetical protein
LKYNLDYTRYQIIVQSYKIFKRMVHIHSEFSKRTLFYRSEKDKVLTIYGEPLNTFLVEDPYIFSFKVFLLTLFSLDIDHGWVITLGFLFR